MERAAPAPGRPFSLVTSSPPRDAPRGARRGSARPGFVHVARHLIAHLGLEHVGFDLHANVAAPDAPRPPLGGNVVCAAPGAKAPGETWGSVDVRELGLDVAYSLTVDAADRDARGDRVEHVLDQDFQVHRPNCACLPFAGVGEVGTERNDATVARPRAGLRVAPDDPMPYDPGARVGRST